MIRLELFEPSIASAKARLPGIAICLILLPLMSLQAAVLRPVDLDGGAAGILISSPPAAAPFSVSIAQTAYDLQEGNEAGVSIPANQCGGIQ